MNNSLSQKKGMVGEKRVVIMYNLEHACQSCLLLFSLCLLRNLSYSMILTVDVLK